MIACFCLLAFFHSQFPIPAWLVDAWAPCPEEIKDLRHWSLMGKWCTDTNSLQGQQFPSVILITNYQWLPPCMEPEHASPRDQRTSRTHTHLSSILPLSPTPFPKMAEETTVIIQWGRSHQTSPTSGRTHTRHTLQAVILKSLSMDWTRWSIRSRGCWSSLPGIGCYQSVPVFRRLSAKERSAVQLDVVVVETMISPHPLGHLKKGQFGVFTSVFP